MCLSTARKGFILGATKGVIAVYDFEKNFFFYNVMSFQIKIENNNNHKITQISANENDNLITIISSNSGDANNPYNYLLFDTYNLDTENDSVVPFFSAGFHTRGINNISTGVTKQIFASCSKDRSVKIWNYYELETTEICGKISQYFAAEPLAVSIHPSSLFLAIAFQTGFEIYSILSDELLLLHKISLSDSSMVKYSNGGHFLVVNDKSLIYLYETIYYKTIIATLEGHPS